VRQPPLSALEQEQEQQEEERAAEEEEQQQQQQQQEQREEEQQEGMKGVSGTGATGCWPGEAAIHSRTPSLRIPPIRIPSADD
jgi:hypothetical protein